MKKVIFLIYLFLLFAIQSLKAQTVYCEINGSIFHNSSYKYAYLADFKIKKLVFAPIIDNNFFFKVIKPENYQNLQLFFEKDSSRNFDYFREQATTYRNNGRTIAVEDAVLEFDGEVTKVKVLRGKLNEIVEEWYLAMKTNKLIEFIDKYPNSNLSLSILKSFFKLNNMEQVVNKYDCKLLFNKLSEEIRTSPEGKEFYLGL